MPKRNEVNSKPLGSSQEESEEDVWEKIMTMKSSPSAINKKDEHGFSKSNTRFFIVDGEEAEIVLLEDIPHVFMGHSLKLRGKNKKPFFVVEACQKMEQTTCGFCTTNKKAVSSARQFVAFVILDSRGSWSTEDGEFDGVPAPKIFLTNLAVAKMIKRLRDDAGGSLKNKVIRLSKDSKQTHANLVTLKDKRDPSVLRVKMASPYAGDLPDVRTIYAPLSDEEVDKILDGMVDFDDDDEDDEPKGKKGKKSGVF